MVRMGLMGKRMLNRMVRRLTRPSPTSSAPAGNNHFPFELPIRWWYQPHSGEPSVSLALRDLCRAGDVAFDVGCWVGEVTLLMSRLVGPSGRVCAFEANPNILPPLTKNLGLNLANNVSLVHRAVWRCSGEHLTFYLPDDRHWESWAGLYCKEFRQTVQVRSVALDDFIAGTGLKPAVIKMDIEGAEREALEGMPRFLQSGRPYLVLEQINGNMSCVEFLSQRGYGAWDLGNYRRIRSAADCLENAVVRNLLFLPEERIHETPYPKEVVLGERNEVSGAEFDTSVAGIAKAEIPVEKGRYLCELDFGWSDPAAGVLIRCVEGGECRYEVQGASEWVFKSYRDFVLDVADAGKCSVECHSMGRWPFRDVGVRSFHYAKVLNHCGAPNNFFVA